MGCRILELRRDEHDRSEWVEIGAVATKNPWTALTIWFEDSPDPREPGTYKAENRLTGAHEETIYAGPGVAA